MQDTQKAVEVAEGQQPVELPAQEKPAEVSAPPTEEARPAEPEGELPEGVSEKARREFEKLKESNRRMAEKLNAYEKPKTERRSALDTFAPQPMYGVPQPQAEVSEDIPEIAPDENGYIDVSVINQTNKALAARLKRLEEEAKAARKKAEDAEVRVAKYEHTEKSAKVYAQFPHLDPTSDQFDEKFSDLVRKELLDQMVNQGKEDYLGAAQRVKTEYYDPTSKPTPPVDTAKQENLQKREQISAPSSSRGQRTQMDDETLIQATRMGNTAALNERLKRSGF